MPFAAELEHRRVRERLGDDDGRRDAAFFELDRVVHTAQRAGSSPADGSDGHLHFPGHLVDEVAGAGLE